MSVYVISDCWRSGMSEGSFQLRSMSLKQSLAFHRWRDINICMADSLKLKHNSWAIRKKTRFQLKKKKKKKRIFATEFQKFNIRTNTINPCFPYKYIIPQCGWPPQSWLLLECLPDYYCSFYRTKKKSSDSSYNFSQQRLLNL